MPYRRLNEALVADHVIPRYERLAKATAGLPEGARAFCAEPDVAGLERLRAVDHESFDAWQGVQHIRFGPIELLMRSFRFAFWPDPRDTAGDQLAELIGGRDREALDPEVFASGSVAVQGFTALERLLFGDQATAALLAGDEEAAFRCEIVQAIAGNLATMAADALSNWRSGADAYAETMIATGPDNPLYRDDREATFDLFQSLRGGLEMVADQKLRLPLGPSAGAARPRRAESWRSDRSMRNIVLNLEAARTLYLGEDGFGFDDYIRDVAGDQKLDDLMRRAFAQTLDTARSVDRPLEEAVADPTTRPALEQLAKEVRALGQLLEERVAPALGLSLGFNSLDGD